MAWLLFLVLAVLFLTAYWWGHHDGREKGYFEGYMVHAQYLPQDETPPVGTVRVLRPASWDDVEP